MEQASPPVIDPGILADNLAALADVAPVLAERLSRAASCLGDTVQPAWARDGTPTFRLRSSDEHGAWFGRTSLPAVRGEALLEQFDAGTGNVLLPGIGQGYEVSRLLERLGVHRAVFVWEPEETALSMALALHRWAEAIRGQRLVFLVCPENALATTLAGWLAEHPGHLCPERIMRWPWSTPPALAACRTAVQQAFSKTHQDRERRMADMLTRLDSGDAPRAGREGGSPAWLVGALHAREAYWTLSAALVRVMEADGMRSVEVGVYGPGQVHPLARARQLVDRLGTRPEAVVLLDVTSRDVPELAAPVTRIISWLSPAARIDGSTGARIGPEDVVVATSSRVRDRLLAAGVSREQVTVLPWPCLIEPAEQEAEATREQSGKDRPVDVVVFADLAPTQPESYGFSLWTQVRIWNVACELIRSRVDSFTEQDGQTLLTRAEREAGARIDDEQVRATMQTALSTGVANALLWPALVGAIREAGYRVCVYGRGWPKEVGAEVLPEPDTLSAQHAVLGRAKVLLYADVTGEVTPLPLLAAGAGAVVLARAHPRDRQPGGLAELLEPGKEMLVFSGIRGLISALRRVLEQAEYRQCLASAALARCRDAHGAAARWRVLKNVVSPFVGKRADQT